MHKANPAYRRTREVAGSSTPSASITPPAELSQVLQNVTTGSYFSALEDDERSYIFQMAVFQAGLARSDNNNINGDERHGTTHRDHHTLSNTGSSVRSGFTPEQMRTVAYVCEGLAQAHLYARETLKIRLLGPAISEPVSIIVEEEQEIGDPEPSQPVNRTTVSHTGVTTEASVPTTTGTAITKGSGEWLNFSELGRLAPMMMHHSFPASFMNALRGKHYLPLNMFIPDILEEFLVGSSATRTVEARDANTGSIIVIPDIQDYLETEDLMEPNEWFMAHTEFAIAVEECFGLEMATMFRDWTRELRSHPFYEVDFPVLRRFDINTRRAFFRCSKPFMLEPRLLEGLRGINGLAAKMRGYNLFIPPSPERPMFELDPASPVSSGFSPTQWLHNDRGPSAPSRQRIELPRKPYDRESERRPGDRPRSLKFCVSCGQSSHLTRACREHVRAFGGDVLCTFDSGRLLLVGSSDHHAELCLKFNIKRECTHRNHRRDGAHRCSLCLGGDHPALSCPSNAISSI